MIEDFLISTHFSFYEMTDSSENPSLVQSNRELAIGLLPVLKRLCVEILEPVRAQFGPVTISSGYRCPGLNEAVHGAPTSQHEKGEAADTNIGDGSSGSRRALLEWIKSSSLAVHQALLEGGCVHVALPTGENDRQICWAERNPDTGLWELTAI